MRMLFLLLYGTGMRIGEALSLSLEDVDLENRVLMVRDSKFFKTRLVPIGPGYTWKDCFKALQLSIACLSASLLDLS